MRKAFLIIVAAAACLVGLTSQACGSATQQQQQQQQRMVYRPRPSIRTDSTGRPITNPDSLPNPEDELFSPSTLIIMYDTTVGKQPLLNAIEAYGASIVYDYNIINALAISIPEGTDIHDAITHFRQVEGVLAVNRDRKMQLMRNGGPTGPR